MSVDKDTEFHHKYLNIVKELSVVDIRESLADKCLKV